MLPTPPPPQVRMAATAIEMLAERLHELRDQSARVVSEGTQHAAEVTQLYQLQAERLEETLGAQVVTLEAKLRVRPGWLEETLGAQVVALEAKLRVRGTGIGRGGVIQLRCVGDS